MRTRADAEIIPQRVWSRCKLLAHFPVIQLPSKLSKKLRTHSARLRIRFVSSSGLRKRGRQGFEDEVLAFVSTVLKREFFCRGDPIYLAGEPATALYFVLKGCARVQFDGSEEGIRSAGGSAAASAAGARWSMTDAQLQPFAFVRAGDTFGEAALVQNTAAGGCGGGGRSAGDIWDRRRLDAVAAVDEVTVYSLGLSGLCRLREAFPTVAAQLEEFCALRAAQARRRAGSSGGRGGRTKKEPCRLRMLLRQVCLCLCFCV